MSAIGNAIQRSERQERGIKAAQEIRGSSKCLFRMMLLAPVGPELSDLVQIVLDLMERRDGLLAAAAA